MRSTVDEIIKQTRLEWLQRRLCIAMGEKNCHCERRGLRGTLIPR